MTDSHTSPRLPGPLHVCCGCSFVGVVVCAERGSHTYTFYLLGGIDSFRIARDVRGQRRRGELKRKLVEPHGNASQIGRKDHRPDQHQSFCRDNP